MNYRIYNAENHDYPIIFSLPHSGVDISENMRKNLREDAILSNTDWFLRELYSFLHDDMNQTLIENNLNRYLVDPNRSPQAIGNGNSYMDNVIYKENTFGKPLYKEKLSKDDIDNRISCYYYPYHQALEKLLKDKIDKFGKVFLIDLHSFALYPKYEELDTCDFVLGNDSDKTSSKDFRLMITSMLEDSSFSVSNNFPFSGGYITKHYGSEKNIESLQIEIRYSTYIGDREFGEEELDSSIIDKDTFNETKNKLNIVFTKIFDVIKDFK
ncbi:N-formylglutamate amidohydrolase [Floricoccus penangensis]|uniref:N-formylglutamate amidohydrolase n=1 Tax=Floricoccus penangensis TaxID=1859475 RepID=UPI00203FD850|nr:N-formylglutamate amidohydrolase [Floricoccus penangensis]URZ86542.1 N-formylglutamate amidohydrolase [Floricoccus penangensis]